MYLPGRRWCNQRKDTIISYFEKESFVMKKLFCICLSVILTLSLFAGCGKPADDGVIDIAIVQQLDHISLDEIRIAIETELESKAQELGLQIRCKAFNGQNDGSVLSQIGAQVVADGYDLIIPIATQAAQSMVLAADGNIPVVYAAVSDPEQAGLTGFDNVTGTSDALNTPYILKMMFTAQPDIKTVGLLYSNSEPNSVTPIAEAKAYLEEKGIPYVEKTGNTADEVLAAANALVGKVDAVFTPTDNAIMASEAAVAEILTAAGIPHYTGADSFVACGAFATCGVNYTELGIKTAQMALDVLTTGQIPPAHVMDGGIITVNTQTADKLRLDYSVFSTMANTVKEVDTQ